MCGGVWQNVGKCVGMWGKCWGRYEKVWRSMLGCGVVRGSVRRGVIGKGVSKRVGM